MAYEQRDNEGVIFKNEKREKDTHPHGTGKAMIGGVMYWVSAWTKEGAKGKFQSLSFRPMSGGANQAQTIQNQIANNQPPDFDGPAF